MIDDLFPFVRRSATAGVLLAAALSGPAAALAAAPAEGERSPIEWQTDLALWSLVSFLLLLWVLKRFAWGPLSRGLNAREARIRQDIANAEAARKKSEALLAEYEGKLEAVQEEIREILAEARRDAEVARQNILSDAAREAELTRNRAIVEIERARDQALKELFDAMSAGVLEATEHVLARTVTAEDERRLIEEALADFTKQPA